MIFTFYDIAFWGVVVFTPLALELSAKTGQGKLVSMLTSVNIPAAQIHRCHDMIYLFDIIYFGNFSFLTMYFTYCMFKLHKLRDSQLQVEWSSTMSYNTQLTYSVNVIPRLHTHTHTRTHNRQTCGWSAKGISEFVSPLASLSLLKGQLLSPFTLKDNQLSPLNKGR